MKVLRRRGSGAALALALLGVGACRGILGLGEDPYLDVDASAASADAAGDAIDELGADGPSRDASRDADADAGADADADASTDAGIDAGDTGAPEAGADAADAGADGGSDSGDAGSEAGSGCPVNDGPMVRLDAPSGSFCIDAYEVTNRQFNVYLAAPGRPFDVPAVCSVDIVDGGDPNRPAASPPAQDSYPPPNVSYCYAWAYCRFVGKRLCGAIAPSHDDAGAPHSDGTASASNEWDYACSNGGANTYPYGDAYDASVCNSQGSAQAPPGSMPHCHGIGAGFEALFDMSGNVAEFDDFSFDSNPAQIGDHGGYWGQGAATACTSIVVFAPYNDTNTGETGIRCCADVP